MLINGAETLANMISCSDHIVELDKQSIMLKLSASLFRLDTLVSVSCVCYLALIEFGDDQFH